MNSENLILESKLLEVAARTNYREATFLISVLDEPDAYGRIIPEDVGEKYAETIIGYPIVAKLKKNIFGQVSDFEGHAVYEEKTKNGKKRKRFGTMPIGSVLNAWVEERELEDFDEPKKCILCSAKLWSGRFPEYFKVLDKLWESGKVSSSWELTATKIEEKDGFKIYKVIEFIGNCILGSLKTPAVKQGGIVEYAEFDDYDSALENALEKDVLSTETAENDLEIESKKEEIDLANKEVKTAKKEEPEVASLTDGDLFRKLNEACRKSIGCDWGYISYWFPEEHTVWFKPCNSEASLDYKLFTYEVENDEVTVSEPTNVKLTVSVADVNEEIASKEEKIQTLTAELELKNQAVISAGEKIGKLNIEIAELKPYKEKVELAEQEKIEMEIAEEKKTLKNNLLKGGLFTEDEIAESEIAELIEARDKSTINSLIAERYIASFDKETVEEVNPNKDVGMTSTASLETEDIDESPSAFMTKFLTRK